jgi:ATP-dependent DNA helicase 2 subunit 2
MPAERAGVCSVFNRLLDPFLTKFQYTVTMFLVDISATMANTRDVELPEGPNGEARTVEVTNLEWSLQFVKLKIQEMVRDVSDIIARVADADLFFQIFNGRKTDQCGIIIFGAEGITSL